MNIIDSNQNDTNYHSVENLNNQLIDLSVQDDKDDSFFRQLFNVYDQNQSGFISIDQFIDITEKSMSPEQKFNEQVYNNFC